VKDIDIFGNTTAVPYIRLIYEIISNKQKKEASKVRSFWRTGMLSGREREREREHIHTYIDDYDCICVHLCAPQ